MNAMTFETLQLAREGSVAEITLSRPELLNRVDAALHRDLIEVFRSFESDRDLRAVVFAATGRVFSAGGDLDVMLEGNADMQARTRILDDAYRLMAALLDVAVPVVTAMHGDAIGLGATLVLNTDAVVSHPAARISDPHVNIGLAAGDGGCLAWPQALGPLRAKRYLLTGDALTAQQGYEFGLVTDLVPNAADVLPAARALAQRISTLPPLAIRGTKATLNNALRLRAAEVMAHGLAQEKVTFGSSDLVEAITAFKEKRAPLYLNR